MEIPLGCVFKREAMRSWKTENFSTDYREAQVPPKHPLLKVRAKPVRNLSSFDDHSTTRTSSSSYLIRIDPKSRKIKRVKTCRVVTLGTPKYAAVAGTTVVIPCCYRGQFILPSTMKDSPQRYNKVFAIFKLNPIFEAQASSGTSDNEGLEYLSNIIAVPFKPLPGRISRSYHKISNRQRLPRVMA